MQYLPAAQTDLPVSGSFQVRQDGLGLGSVSTIAPGIWSDIGFTGSTAFYDPWDGHAPIGGNPTGVFGLVLLNTGGAAYYNVPGATVRFTALKKRTYLALFTIQYDYETANWPHAVWRITDNGSATGMYPVDWLRSYNTPPNNSDTFIINLPFILPNWAVGVHTLQLQRSNNGAGTSQIEFRICGAIVL